MVRSPKTIGLPLSKELRSNKLEDIQHHFELYKEALDNMYKLLRSDISTIIVESSGWIYFGGKDTDGTWRIGRVNNNWEMQRRESGTYVKKGASTV